jgi:hypothetical protein
MNNKQQTKCILYKQENGRLGICFPCNDDFISKLLEDKTYLDAKVVLREDIDKNTFEFMEMYDFENQNLVFVPERAKEIWLEHYRRARTPLLAALDVDFMRAVESGNTDLQKEIAAKKQALRDVTKTELPDTLEGIKNTWPEILGQNPFKK